jgi:hypothetical protein
MDIIYLCFQCPGKFCELLPDALEADAVIVEELISQSLRSLPWLVILDRVAIKFSQTENMYVIQVRMWNYDHFNAYADEAENTGLRIETLICQALLQLFWVICLDGPGC